MERNKAMRGDIGSTHRLLLVLAVIFITAVLHGRWDAHAELLFAVLIVGTFFFGFIELIFLAVIGAMLIDMQTAFGLEFFLFILLPSLVLLVRRVYPLDGWFDMFITLLLSFVILYGVSAFSSIFNHLDVYSLLFLESALPSVLFGMSIFLLFEYSYK